MHNVNRWHANKWYALRHSEDTIERHECACWDLLDDLFPDEGVDLFDYILHHDEHEAVMGDIPATEKAQWSPELRALYEARERQVRKEMGLPDCPAGYEDHAKLVDMLDAYLWAAKHEPRAVLDDGFPEMLDHINAIAASLGVSDTVAALIEKGY